MKHTLYFLVAAVCGWNSLCLADRVTCTKGNFELTATNQVTKDGRTRNISQVVVADTEHPRPERVDIAKIPATLKVKGKDLSKVLLTGDLADYTILVSEAINAEPVGELIIKDRDLLNQKQLGDLFNERILTVRVTLLGFDYSASPKDQARRYKGTLLITYDTGDEIKEQSVDVACAYSK